jgi:hypothetical protein
VRHSEVIHMRVHRQGLGVVLGAAAEQASLLVWEWPAGPRRLPLLLGAELPVFVPRLPGPCAIFPSLVKRLGPWHRSFTPPTHTSKLSTPANSDPPIPTRQS